MVPLSESPISRGQIAFKITESQSWCFFIPFKSQGHIGIGPQPCHLCSKITLIPLLNMNIEIDNDERGVIGNFTTMSDIRITKV